MVNRRLLKSKRCERSMTQKDLAREMGISIKTYNFKENGRVDFTNTEINTIKNILGLTTLEVEKIFLQQ